MSADSATSRRWWAPIGAGALLCLACCLAPMLIAAGVLGSGIVLTGLSWLEPLGLALIGIGGAGMIWSRTRSRRSGRERSVGDNVAGSCAGPGCGCATNTA